MRTLQNMFQNNSFQVLQCGNGYTALTDEQKQAINNPVKVYGYWNTSAQKPFPDLPLFRIYWVKEGTATLLTKEGIVTLQAGHMYFFPANTVIGSKCDGPMHFYFVNFKNDFLIPYFDFIPYDTCIAENKTLCYTFETLNNLYEKCGADTTSNNKPVFDSAADTLLSEACCKILLSAFLHNVSPCFPAVEKFKEALLYINNHLNEQLSLNTLSSLMNYSPVYFSNSFTKAFHKTPVQYITEKKLQLAKQLLHNSSFTIKETALRCGFADQFYFSNWFYKNTEMYPSDFKRFTF